ncbi:MAG: hypothetical protein CVU61_03780 [Deltaproteobacteria bacterium HGW-Deltaproteobacteria-19]|nr:MAG: hypothetical protein CVU61_03780 [Deltaproteobacteria bacterium HGW-Deltaproteobacteria-19]
MSIVGYGRQGDCATNYENLLTLSPVDNRLQMIDWIRMGLKAMQVGGKLRQDAVCFRALGLSNLWGKWAGSLF